MRPTFWREPALLAACALAWTCADGATALPLVNPPAQVDPALQPYAYRFVQALKLHGFEVADTPRPGNCDLRLTLASGAVSMDITATLLRSEKVLVETPVNVKTVRNLPWLRNSAIADAAELAANRFSRDLAAYVRTLDAQAIGANPASTTGAAN
jgi:hypothetical protein